MNNNKKLTLILLGVICNLTSGFSSSRRPPAVNTAFDGKPPPVFYRSDDDNNSAVLIKRNQKNAPVASNLPATPSSFGRITTTEVDEASTLVAAKELLPELLLGHTAEVLPIVRGGDAEKPVAVRSVADGIASFWGAFGVIYILMKAIVRVVPIALEPFTNGAAATLTPFQLGAYISTCLFFAYSEGYKGFQRKFAPLVVARSFTLRPGSSFSKIHHTILAPLYSMGLFHATKKRMIISWSISTGVSLIVYAVKKLPYPWRNIVDAGVVVGLTWGAAAIAIGYFLGLLKGGIVDTDPAMPKRG